MMDEEIEISKWRLAGAIALTVIALCMAYWTFR